MVVLASLLAFPCWSACSRLITKWDRDFNPHGDLHHNVFIDLPEKPSANGDGKRGDVSWAVSQAGSGHSCPVGGSNSNESG